MTHGTTPLPLSSCYSLLITTYTFEKIKALQNAFCDAPPLKETYYMRKGDLLYE